MYRDKIEEIRIKKNVSNKKLAEESGISIDTIGRIIHPENPDKESPRVNTLQDICNALQVELWEIFYCGDKSFVDLQAELAILKEERDRLLAENAIIKDKIESLRDQVDTLKDEVIATHKYYNKLKPNN
jgi:transcriptional regulator with XRE-family HTH domain